MSSERYSITLDIFFFCVHEKMACLSHFLTSCTASFYRFISYRTHEKSWASFSKYYTLVVKQPIKLGNVSGERCKSLCFHRFNQRTQNSCYCERAISVKFMTTSVHLFPYLHFLIYSGKMFWKHHLSRVQEPSILLERTHLIDGLHYFNDIKARERDQEKTCLWGA